MSTPACCAGAAAREPRFTAKRRTPEVRVRHGRACPVEEGEPVSKSKTRRPSPAPARKVAKPSRPWVVGGIDYGPAVVAVTDLATWAFELAANDVGDWPEGRRRVRSARRYVLDRLRGRRSLRTPADDVLFTAGLLARIFDADLSLGMTEMVGILDELGLPTEVVPLVPRRQTARAITTGLLPFRRPRRAEPADDEPRCPVCERHPRLRNAA